ncbi:MAG TPA: CHAD domain-containing protein [Lacunisphaera sp.]|nr:CHAD domain-containing protein [Lacunisphaera sp.]
MKLRLPSRRPIGGGLAVLVAGLVADAAAELGAMETTPVDAVHRARVALKRARSALRLLEKAGADWAVMPQVRLVELGGRMSAAREAAVTADLARKLARRLRGREREVARLLAARQGAIAPEGAEAMQRALTREAQLLGYAPAPTVTPAGLRDLLRQALDRTSRRYYDAALKPSRRSVHEWRKAVIVLRDQVTLAAGRWPEGAGAAQPLLAKFGRRLGRLGDLSLLQAGLQRPWVPPELEAARRTLHAQLRVRRERETLLVLLRWLKLERELSQLLSEENRPRRRDKP